MEDDIKKYVLDQIEKQDSEQNYIKATDKSNILGDFSQVQSTYRLP